MWEWLLEHSSVLGLFVAALIPSAALIQYFLIKRAEERARIFTNYHQLLEDLNGAKNGSDGVATGQYIDRQVAIIFELRSLVRYHPVTLRILERSIKRWGASENLLMETLINSACCRLSI